MNAVIRIARRELSTYMNTWWGWLILAMVLLLDGLMFNAFAMTNNAKLSAEVLEEFFF